ESVGLIYLSHMGEQRVNQESLAHHLVTRDLTKLQPGRIHYALLCKENGGIIDDVLVYAVQDGGYLLVVNAGNQESDFEWIRGHDAGIHSFNVGSDWALIGVQGPLAAMLVQRLSSLDLSEVKYYAFVD